MPILTKEVEIKIGSRNFKYYKELGYDFNNVGDKIKVKIEDLQKYTKTKVFVLCDMCKKNTMMVGYCDYNKVVENTGDYVCKNCASEKRKITNNIKYGFSNVSQVPEIKEKVRQTNIEHFGVDNYSKTTECHERIRQTCLKKYNSEHHLKNQDVKNKRYNTNLIRYGTKHTLSIPSIREKITETNLERYGFAVPSQSPEIREKITQTLYANFSQKVSKQQKYISDLYQGILNYPISRFSADICFPEEKLTIEYDGGFHNGNVKIGKITQEEFEQKEIIRNNIIKREGYKQMRISSSKDKLPSDQVLLQMLEESRNYFNTTNHSWCIYDIDKSLLFNAENKQGVPYDFGTLRRIK